jgi:hypothetical protein
MRSRELTCTEYVKAFLVAGRRLRSEATCEEFGTISGSVDRLAEELGQPVVALPPGNRNFSKPSDRCGTGLYVVGVLAGQADCHWDYESVVPSPVEHNELLAALDAARSLPWADIAALFPDPRWITQEAELHLMACGPLAGGKVCYGVPVELYGPEEEWDYDDHDEKKFLDDKAGPAWTTPGLDLVRGTLMNQSPQPRAVYGVRMTNAGWEGEPVTVDVSADAHRGRVAAMGELSAQSSYYLIGYYD